MLTKIAIFAAVTVVAATAATIPFTGRTANIRPGNITTTESSASEDVPQVVSLQVTPSGIEPRETIASRGRFLILLQNRTGRRDLNFWLARENEGRVVESKPQQRDWKAQVQLAPGTYIVGETNHPEWTSIIRVTN